MPTTSLSLICLAAGLASFLLPAGYVPIVAALLCLALFRHEQLEEEEEVNQYTDERRESFITVVDNTATIATTTVETPRTPTTSPDIIPHHRLHRNSSVIADVVKGETAEERVRFRLSAKKLDMAIRLVAKLRADPAFRPDHALLDANLVNARRFLQSRNWNESAAESLWRKGVEWRINFQLTEKRKRLQMMRKLGPGIDPAFDFAERHWFCFKTGPDTFGVPGIVTRAGTADPGGLVRELNNSVDFFLERMLDLLEEVLEEAIRLDVLDYGIVEISDMREFDHVPHYFSRAFNSISAFTSLAKIMDEVYVERVRQVVLVGAPGVFRTIWAMVQPLVPRDTKKKIVMTGMGEESKWMLALKQHFPVASIPACMGGSGSDAQVLEGLLVPKGSFARFKQERSTGVCDIGLIADVQHSAAEDGTNFKQTRVRRYQGALTGLAKAVDHWKSEKVQCVIQLGDLLDGNAAAIGDSHQAIERVNREFARLGPLVPIHHVVGNHELYNLPRPALAKALNGPVHPRSFTVQHKYRFIVLDAYEHAVIGLEETHESFQKGQNILLNNHPRDYRTSKDWLKGIVGVHRRFVPYNGAVSPEQLQFLEKELQHCVSSSSSGEGQYAVIVTHVPLQPGSCSSSCLVWNYEQVLQILQKYSHVKYGGTRGVVLVLAGHDHKGGYALDATGIHHVTLASPLEAKDCLAHAVLRLGQNGMFIRGFGEVPDRPLSLCKTELEAKEAFDTFKKDCVHEFHRACQEGGFKSKTYDQCERAWVEHGGAWDALPEGLWPMRYADGG